MQTLMTPEKIDLLEVDITKKQEIELEKFCKNPISDKIVKKAIASWHNMTCGACHYRYSLKNCKYDSLGPICPNCGAN